MWNRSKRRNNSVQNGIFLISRPLSKHIFRQILPFDANTRIVAPIRRKYNLVIVTLTGKIKNSFSQLLQKFRQKAEECRLFLLRTGITYRKLRFPIF
jgi:hypothetical protein